MVDSTERLDLAYEAALLYYNDGYTMDFIASRLGLSRPTVSRLLNLARKEGIVQINVKSPENSSLARDLSELTGVSVTTVPMPTTVTDLRRLQRVCEVAEPIVADAVVDGTNLGVAWGTTTSALAGCLKSKDVHSVNVIQLNGAANSWTSGIFNSGGLFERFAEAFGAHMHFFPVPTYFDYYETKEAMWKERSIRHAHKMIASCDVAVFSVGGFDAEIPSQVYSGGYFTRQEIQELRANRIVGDVCTVLLREDGTWEDIETNTRATGPTPANLQRIPRRICLVAGEGKAAALAGAVRAKTMTDLIVDDALAKALRARLSSS